MKKALLRGSTLLTCLLLLQACPDDPPPKASPVTPPAVTPPKPASAEGAVQEPPAAQAPTRVTVGGTWLELRDCELAHGVGTGSSTLSLQLPSPCQFARDATGSVRIVESAGVSVLLVESSRSIPPLVPGGAAIDCDTHLRGIVVTGQTVQLSRDTQKVARCAPALWDEKMFHVFALHTVAP